MDILSGVSLGGKVDHHQLQEIRAFLATEREDDAWMKQEMFVPVLSVVLESLGWKLHQSGGGVKQYLKIVQRRRDASCPSRR